MEKVKKEAKEKIMEMVQKAGDSNNYETSWDDEGAFKSKKKSEVKKGKNSRAAGSRFELKVRRDLESKGRINDKWNNNVDITENKLIIAKKKFNPFSKAMTLGTGFPDFISIKHVNGPAPDDPKCGVQALDLYSVIGVESKMNGLLSKIEKEKCVWYLRNKIFSEIWIAKKGEKRGEIKYDDFLEKYGKKYNLL